MHTRVCVCVCVRACFKRHHSKVSAVSKRLSTMVWLQFALNNGGVHPQTLLDWGIESGTNGTNQLAIVRLPVSPERLSRTFAELMVHIYVPTRMQLLHHHHYHSSSSFNGIR